MLGISTLSGEDLIKIIKVRLKIYMERMRIEHLILMRVFHKTQ